MFPNLDRESPTPLYLQIQKWIHQQITLGAWPEHYQLKSEIDLAKELNVNRGTLRNAIQALIDEGLLVRIHGKGTFVAPRALEQPLAESLITFSEALINQGIEFNTTVREKKVIVPNQHTASLLNLSPNDRVFFMKRVRYVNIEPVILLKNYVVYRHCEGIEEYDFQHNQLFEILEDRYGLEIDWGRRSFEATVADDEIAEELNISPCDPVMYTQQIVHLKDDGPVELSDFWTRGDRFRVSAVVKREHKKRVKHFHEYK